MVDEDATGQVKQAADLGYELLRLGWQLQRGANKAFSTLDVTLVKVVMLLYIERGHIQPKQLTNALGIQFPATSTLLSQLDEQGLIKRSGDGADHRHVNLELTLKGRQVLQAAEKAWQQNSRLDILMLTKSELATFIKFVQMIVPH